VHETNAEDNSLAGLIANFHIVESEVCHMIVEQKLAIKST
jgi:hypothetical protein